MNLVCDVHGHLRSIDLKRHFIFKLLHIMYIKEKN
jgi:hypothetical protein